MIFADEGHNPIGPQSSDVISWLEERREYDLRIFRLQEGGVAVDVSAAIAEVWITSIDFRVYEPDSVFSWEGAYPFVARHAYRAAQETWRLAWGLPIHE